MRKIRVSSVFIFFFFIFHCHHHVKLQTIVAFFLWFSFFFFFLMFASKADSRIMLTLFDFIFNLVYGHKNTFVKPVILDPILIIIIIHSTMNCTYLNFICHNFCVAVVLVICPIYIAIHIHLISFSETPISIQFIPSFQFLLQKIIGFNFMR